MAEPHAQGEHGGESLRGTLAFVLLVGLIILVVWVAVFALFLSRS